MLHKGRAVSRTELAEQISDGDTDRGCRWLEVLVGRLRRKIGEGRIETRRGGGLPAAAGRPGIRPHSASARPLLWGGGLTAAALLVSCWGLSAPVSDFVARRLEAGLAADAHGIMAAAEGDETKGVLRVAPEPTDPRFGMPRSGCYGQVADGSAVLARSPSLLPADLGPDGAATVAGGAALVAHRQGFTAPGDGRALSVTLPGPRPGPPRNWPRSACRWRSGRRA